MGDEVEVRDTNGKWSSGIVESIDPKSGYPSVIKHGWDMGYEWDECRVPVSYFSCESHSRENAPFDASILSLMPEFIVF